eukprot:Plantae.Rhodophyta-Palmaria_palmata.ctg5272.p1 GENE.Plantae.Rhodophyta-Palmaria_palmata.ctg5272~~Plantae.Rhodophyta-Palmaria_palmata.ctg5272.p1  ORF type:complete len:291 (-),score=14.17 Plantae.Rhodophyta-Palmaria_palmata.ctg5272:290-1162(-)
MSCLIAIICTFKGGLFSKMASASLRTKQNLWYMSSTLFTIRQLAVRNRASQSCSEILSEQLKIVEKNYSYVCGYSSLNDVKILLQRNQIWSSEIEKYLLQTIDSCVACHSVQPPKPMRKVSIKGVNRSFNDSAQVDHFFLDQKAILHVMETSCRYSTGKPVPSTSVSHATEFFEERYFSEFWIPGSIRFDPAFNTQDFVAWCKQHGIDAEPIPVRRHNKLSIESKHKILRDIYTKLKLANPKARFNLFVARMFDISNILYGNGYVSTFEAAKGYTKPVSPGGSPIVIPSE